MLLPPLHRLQLLGFRNDLDLGLDLDLDLDLDLAFDKVILSPEASTPRPLQPFGLRQPLHAGHRGLSRREALLPRVLRLANPVEPKAKDVDAQQVWKTVRNLEKRSVWGNPFTFISRRRLSQTPSLTA